MSPAISVVVCIYNVERYLRDCLESIANQSFTDFECILCDDDSTDASGLIASSFAEADSRFRYVHQANRGPGPAGGRNGGIPFVTGDRMLFVDSDDILLPDALAVMHASAEATGSELVIGGVDRFNSSGRWPSFLHQRVHETDRLTTSIDDYPEMVWDSTAWNKLISTTLWMEHIEWFDEGRLYEDLYPMIRLMCLANSVDILSDTVYLWRDRESKTSVTQQVASPRGLIDKVDQMLKLDQFLSSTDRLIAKQAQDHKLLTADLIWMLDDLDKGSQDFHEAFWAEVPKLVAAMDPHIRKQLPPALREQYDSIVEGDRVALSLSRREARGAGFRPDLVRQVFSTDDAREVSDSENLFTELFGRATSMRIDGEDLVIGGFAALDRIRLRKHQGTFEAWLEVWETGQRVTIDADLSLRPRIHLTRQGPQLHRYTGFEIRLPAEKLANDTVPVANVMVGARIAGPNGEAGSERLRIPRTLEWTYPQNAGRASVRAYRDHEGFLSFKVSLAVTASMLHFARGQLDVALDDPDDLQVCLYDPVLKRRWMAESLSADGHTVRLRLDSLASGEYQLQALKASREFEDGWVPIIDPRAKTSTMALDDRVVRLHHGSANTFVEIGESELELRNLEPTLQSNIDDRVTELARIINRYTWI